MVILTDVTIASPSLNGSHVWLVYGSAGVENDALQVVHSIFTRVLPILGKTIHAAKNHLKNMSPGPPQN